MHFVLIFNLSFLLLSASAISDPLECESFSIKKMGRTHDFQRIDSGVARDLRSIDAQSGFNYRLHLQTAHGILNIIGWGTLLPIGAMVARYYRRFPLKCDEWYNLHVLCQTSGYLLGSVSWIIGLCLGNSSKQHNFRANLVLGTIIFSLSTIQMLAIFLQPKKEDIFRKCWKIYHHLLGYALIVLIVANIFQGISNKSEVGKWVYVGILVVLTLIGAVLEVYRFIKSRNPHQMALDSS